MIYETLKGKGESGIDTKQDGRIGRAAPDKTADDRVKHVHDHINSFPRVEPHYCSRDSTMQYLSPELNIAQMYRLYKKYCQENDILHLVKEHKYRDIFLSDFRLKCFCPKTDQCTVCNTYYTATGGEKEQLKESCEEHKVRGKEALTEKAVDKDKTKADESYHCVTFDLQAVLTAPFAGDAQLYYKRKLAVYNFTIYDNSSANGHCFLWDEGGRGANEIASILLSYLHDLPTSICHFTSFSDTCAGQNRNQFMAAAMLYAVQKIDHLETIDLKYMESGHLHAQGMGGVNQRG